MGSGRHFCFPHNCVGYVQVQSGRIPLLKINKDIEFNIIKWLHLAGDQEGGRRKRLKKREAQQHIADPH
ncbi:hypothetical protein Q7C36_004189 [Tachysurus vachellii]|uniref:Uncharacterized protein n=1 Tax=Tachysurus vachellii TaxID=175792 RepID=A0AA88NLX6_TACVA|nr:hypothetical protein Q7C36_004189 [Tachysurus vachellii]